MDRLQIVFLALIGVGALWLVWQGTKLWLRRGIQADGLSLKNDQPTLLYFSSDGCAPCRLQQAPTIVSLRQAMGERAEFQEYDAVEHPELVRQFRILTVPTTVVMSPCGDVVAVNHGVTTAEKLQDQLDTAADTCG
jgi:thioredoxin-like negative regulator of GroEL